MEDPFHNLLTVEIPIVVNSPVFHLASNSLGDSALIGANAIYQYMCIDDHLYKGISELSGERIDNFSDLSAKLETYSHDSQGLTDGALSKIKGHVAESHVSEHFKETGIDVT